MGSLGNTALLKEVKNHELEGLGMSKALLSRLSTLDDLLEATYTIRCPEQSDHENRRDLIRIFNEISKELYGKLCPVVVEFGSFVMNMFSPESDLDLSINFHNRDVTRNERIQTLRRFSKKFRKLQSKQMVKNVQLIPTARVPVLKVTDCGSNIDCDFSVENRDGIAKSQIIFIISAIDERFRKLSIMLKAWAKTQGINSSKDGTLNSLSLILLAAFHLQCAEPPILPPFSALLKDGFDLPTVAKNVVPFMNYGQKNKESLLQLFVTLLIRLKSVEKLWAEGLCVSAYEASWMHKQVSKNKSIYVEDFTDRSQNVARAVRPLKAIIIYESIEKSLSQINSFVDGKMEWKKLEMLLFGPCHSRLAKPVMAYGQGAPLKRVLHCPIPTKDMQLEAEVVRTLDPSVGVITHDQSAPVNPTPIKKNQKGKKKGTLTPSKGITTHCKSAPLVLHNPTPTKKERLAAEKKEGTMAPSKGTMTRDQSATLVLHDPTPTEKKRLVAETVGTPAPSKGTMTPDQRATPTKKQRLAAEKKETLPPSKGVMTQDQSAPLHPVLHNPNSTKKIGMTAKKEGTLAPSKDSTKNQPGKRARSSTGGTSQGQGRMTHETEASGRSWSYATQNSSRFMHGAEGMGVHGSSFAPPFAHEPSTSQSNFGIPPFALAHELSSSRSFIGFPPAFPNVPCEHSYLSTPGFPAVLPNAPLHPPPRVIDGFHLPDRPFDPYIESVGRLEVSHPGRLSQTRSDLLYESGRSHMSYESAHPHRSYESDRLHMSYESVRPHRSYDIDRQHRSYESDLPYGSYGLNHPHRLYESARPDRPYESAYPDRTYEPAHPDRAYELARPSRTYEPARPDRTYEPARPHRPYESAHPHRPYESDRSHKSYESDRPHRSYESDRRYEAPRGADRPPLY